MTSPSIVEDEGTLYMMYCAWNDFPNLWIYGAISDDGKTWELVGEVSVPSCMEGSLTKGPDGHFYTVAEFEGKRFTMGVVMFLLVITRCFLSRS